MAERTPGALDVVGRLMVEMGGSSASVECLGERIVVRFPDLRTAIGTARLWSKGGGRRESLLDLHRGLAAAGLTVEVAAGGATVGVIGVGSRPGLASRLLGLDSLEIRLGGVLGSLTRPGDPPK